MSTPLLSEQMRPDFAERGWGKSFRLKTSESPLLHVDNEMCALLYYVETGLLNIRSEKISLLVSPKMAVWVPVAVECSVQVLGGGAAGWLVSVPERACRSAHVDLVRLWPANAMLAAAEQILTWSSDASLPALDAQVLETLARELEASESSGELEIPLPVSERLASVAEQIFRAPDDMRGLDFWSREAGMSRRSFTRVFQQETGLSFAKWRNRVRLATAVQKLSAGASVASIALALGYKNASAFHALFKRTFGLSPLTYMKQYSVDQEELQAE